MNDEDVLIAAHLAHWAENAIEFGPLTRRLFYGSEDRQRIASKTEHGHLCSQWVGGSLVHRFYAPPAIGVASKMPLPHNVIMAEVHPFTFTFKIEADPLREMRYRWTVCEGDQNHLRSPQSYATRGEAQIEAAKALSNRVAHWRSR